MPHTPGPWIADQHFGERQGARRYILILRPGNDPVPVAIVHISADGYGHDEGEANTNLIVAAPDMVDALQDVLRCPQAAPWLARLQSTNGGTNVFDAVRAAVCKAKGAA